ncbi:Histidine kinase-, DNA gyrase B-, and HSP90-like ATPase [Paenibacillus sp. 1_12]|nr:Histidine kinase-, DNA gyrase B-, and HSP90-like ATPase [Paenibacillus sp. 1_12]
MCEDFDKCSNANLKLLEQCLADAIAPKLHMNQDFMINILTTIDSYAIQVGIEEISDIIQSYSFILRYIFYVDRKFATINEEITYLEKYWQLLSYRDQNINLILKIPKELKDLQILRLSLFPLVENCIYHGFKNGFDENCYIEIQAYILQSNLIIEIKDNGFGIPEETLNNIFTEMEESILNSTLKNKKSGNGIMNVHNRIRLVYGKNYGLKIITNEKLGTIIGMKLPFYLTTASLADL